MKTVLISDADSISEQESPLVRIRLAFSNMPYGSVANFDYNLSGERALEVIAKNLEKLKEILEKECIEREQEIRDFHELNTEISTVAKFMKRLNTISKAR